MRPMSCGRPVCGAAGLRRREEGPGRGRASAFQAQACVVRASAGAAAAGRTWRVASFPTRSAGLPAARAFKRQVLRTPPATGYSASLLGSLQQGRDRLQAVHACPAGHVHAAACVGRPMGPGWDGRNRRELTCRSRCPACRRSGIPSSPPGPAMPCLAGRRRRRRHTRLHHSGGSGGGGSGVAGLGCATLPLRRAKRERRPNARPSQEALCLLCQIVAAGRHILAALTEGPHDHGQAAEHGLRSSELKAGPWRPMLVQARTDVCDRCC